MEEINAMIDKAECESAAGLGQDSEEMFREFEQELAGNEHDESRLAASQSEHDNQSKSNYRHRRAVVVWTSYSIPKPCRKPSQQDSLPHINRLY